MLFQVDITFELNDKIDDLVIISKTINKTKTVMMKLSERSLKLLE